MRKPDSTVRWHLALASNRLCEVDEERSLTDCEGYVHTCIQNALDILDELETPAIEEPRTFWRGVKDDLHTILGR